MNEDRILEVLAYEKLSFYYFVLALVGTGFEIDNMIRGENHKTFALGILSMLAYGICFIYLAKARRIRKALK